MRRLRLSFSPLSLRQSLFKLRNKGWERGPQDAADRAQLNHVEAPLAHFRFADEGLAQSDLLGKLYLGEASSSAGFTEQDQQGGIFVGVDRFFHAHA